MASTASKATYSSAQSSKTKCKAKKPKPKPPPPKKGFQMPPMSITKVPPSEPELQILKRRHYSEKEDLKKIKETLMELKDKKVTAEEFVSLIAQYTSDNGEVLIKVMADELSNFRKMIKKIYETMTQDMSDVLANEQIQIHELYQERMALYTEKIERTLKEILAYIPNFNREEFYRDEADYLARAFPIPAEQFLDEETAQLLERQQAYHRIQWLRSESVRLHDENTKLQERLHEVRKLQKIEMCKARAAETLAEQKQLELENTQTEMEEKLDTLNDSIEKALVDNEKKLHLKSTKQTNEDTRKKREESDKAPRGVKKKPKKKRPEWNSEISENLEFGQIESVLHTDISSISLRAKTAKKKRMILKGKERPSTIDEQSQQIENPEIPHYSPTKSPGRGGSPLRGDSMNTSLQMSLDEPRCRSSPNSPFTSPREIRNQMSTSRRSMPSPICPVHDVSLSFTNVPHSTPIEEYSRTPCKKRSVPYSQKSPCPVHPIGSSPGAQRTRPYSGIREPAIPEVTSTISVQISSSQITMSLENISSRRSQERDHQRDPCRQQRRSSVPTCDGLDDDQEELEIMTTPPCVDSDYRQMPRLDKKPRTYKDLRPQFDEENEYADEGYMPPTAKERCRPCAPSGSQRMQGRRSQGPCARGQTMPYSRRQRKAVPGPQEQWGGPSDGKAIVHKYTRRRYPSAGSSVFNGEEQEPRRGRRYVSAPPDHPECFPGCKG